MQSPAGNHTPEEGYVVEVVDNRIHTDRPDEPGALGGRPADDRALEFVEGGVGLAAGLAIGTAVAGPVGTLVGAIVGATAGVAIGEAWERHMGRVAKTTNASDDPIDGEDEGEVGALTPGDPTATH